MKNLTTLLLILLSVTVFGQGRAVNQEVKIAEGTGAGADGYISNVTFTNNTMGFTGELSAFSGNISNVANTSFANVFTANQTVPYSVYGVSWNGSNFVPTMDAIYDKIESLTFAHSSLTGLDYASAGHTGFAGTGVANTFTQAQTVPFVAYGVSWSGNNNVPTMAALYTKIESIDATDHSTLSNLSYALSGHTGFAGTAISNTFTQDQIVPAEVYGVGWNGSNEVPTKNDVYDKIETLGGGGDGYISNVTESANSITFTGIGSAFNGSIGTIAKTDQTNDYSSTQYMGTSSSNRTEVGAAFVNIRQTSTQSLRFQDNLGDIGASLVHYEGTLFDIESDDDVKLRRGTRELRIESGGIEMDLDAATSSNVVYYDATTEELTYGAAPSGSGTVTSVAAGNGMDFTTITTSGSVTLGTPSTITSSTTNSTTSTSHTHALDDINIFPVRFLTTNGTLLTTDHTVINNTGATGLTWTLPSSPTTGQVLVLVNRSSSSAITLSSNYNSITGSTNQIPASSSVTIQLISSVWYQIH